jgi:HORMA domain-containing protein
MSYSFTNTSTFTFTIVHARYLASKVAADMHLCAQYYGQPSEQRVREFAEELAQYLNEGYVQEYEFGYQQRDRRVVSWHYEVDEDGVITTDDRAGKVVPYADISGAIFFNHLTPNSRYARLSASQQIAFLAGLPVQRANGQAPSNGLGYWTSDRSYHSGGRGLSRQTFQPLS